MLSCPFLTSCYMFHSVNKCRITQVQHPVSRESFTVQLLPSHLEFLSFLIPSSAQPQQKWQNRNICSHVGYAVLQFRFKDDILWKNPFFFCSWKHIFGCLKSSASVKFPQTTTPLFKTSSFTELFWFSFQSYVTCQVHSTLSAKLWPQSPAHSHPPR